jgi:two-component system, sporulation sensor kinase D
VYRTAAHELRAPLAAMMVNLDLLQDGLADDRQERYVGVVREELVRLNRSLAAMLSQTIPPSEARQRFDLKALVQELGALLAPQARRQQVEVLLDLPAEEAPLVGARDRLKQALLNVAVNALEAMPKGGQMRMELAMEGARARVAISDTGRGIPAELLERIYESDFTTKGNGSGIGLYVARTLVHFHGGTIQAHSGEGRGTRVEVVLPIVPRS